ncbi:MAG: tRNA-dihydrouridine synthase family protein [Deltaproteobacteria bacterium]|nr:tRNA-dihydrouridine synthase family protein [Deltaproteobacteria bacterium]
MSVVTELLAASPVWLAPMEDVSDAPFRAICRSVGANVCVTEFVNAEQLTGHSKLARKKIVLGPGDRPTAIQIYGADPERLVEAARIAEAARPAFIDLNCGCWIPKIVGRGAGAGWLRDPEAMTAMARRVVEAVDLPVTVKTRIGWGPESHMPIVDLARRLQDAGVAALTIHCRTAQVGHSGPADWSWARRAREVVKIPVIVNGDISSADAVVRALTETGCAGVMIGRAAIDHPWIFREATALLAGRGPSTPTDEERVALYRAIVVGNVAKRGERRGVTMSRRHRHVLGHLLAEIRPRLFAELSLRGTLAVLDDLTGGTTRTRSSSPIPSSPSHPSLARGSSTSS